ncbi:MAG: NAD-binding protein, partial [Actinobacteria bacterium]|nr:NAD-binding protein [Actinomycetota bacterium]
LARDHGLVFVDAPVLGTKAPAEKGELVVLASGPEDVHTRVDPVFDVVGRRTLWVGEAGAGTRLKLATNSWVLTIVEGAAETLALAEGLGLDPRLVLEAVAGGPLDLPYLQTKGKAMIERDFAPSFRLALAAKDARLVAEAAGQAGLDLPLLTAIRDRLEQGADSHGDEDLAATFLTSAPA